MLIYQRMTGWWLRYTYPSEKYDFVNGFQMTTHGFQMTTHV